LIGATPLQRPSALRSSQAASVEGARKKIQPMQTKWKVNKREIHFHCALARKSRGNAALEAAHQRCTTRPMAWKPPHRTKVQAAPCHKPPRSIVNPRFAAVRLGPRREPPSGMKR